MELLDGKKIYFVSDSHLGVPDWGSSLTREKKLVLWLNEVSRDAAEIYLLGDIFDFWFEYKHVVPKGYSRLFGKLAELTDSGIKIYYFTGNHDMWMKNYFANELNVNIIRNPVYSNYNNKIFYIGHGDGLGKGDSGYKFLKKIFSNKIARKLYSLLHPDIAIPIALFFSDRSRYSRGDRDLEFHGPDNERLLNYAKHMAEKAKTDYFIFGHRHLPLDIEIIPGIRYINCGDWLHHFSYVEFDGSNLYLKTFKDK